MTLADLRPIKAKALNFPEPLKSLILSEPDMIDAQDFISKLGTWERLAKMNTQKEVKLR
jgi:hypothetical protein